MALKRTYGRARHENGAWILEEIEPHVRIALKNNFPRIPKTGRPPFRLEGDAQTDADLAWFMERYPLDISLADLHHLHARKTLFEAQQQELATLLSDAWQPTKNAGFREGESPYPYQAQAAELARRTGSLLLMDDLGLGKAQPLTAAILTPDGWTSMGALRAGSRIVGRDGRSYRVTGVFPQGMKPAFRVTFSDGVVTECCDDHLWTVRDDNRRRRNKGWATKPLRDIVRQGWLNKAGKPKWEIPLIEPAEYTQASPLPIPPYVLGVLIGDGYLTGPTVTFSVPPPKRPVLERVSALVGAERVSGPTGSTSSPQFHIVGEEHSRNDYRRAIVGMGLNVPSTRRAIPYRYQFAPSADRLELLRGLMDTDGSARRGRVTYHTCSPQLAVDVAHLVRSLGGTATVRRYDRTDAGKPVEWQVSIRMAECPFALPYKAAGCPAPSTHSRPRRFIRNIEAIGDKPQQCIAVDAPDHLYVTDGFIVTHNTVTACAMFADPQYLPALVVANTHLVRQWAEKIYEFTTLTTHEIKASKPYELPPADVYLVTYTKLAGWIDYAERAGFKSIVFEEVQELRNGTETAKGKACAAFRAQALVALGLSATPVYNYGFEVFEIINILAPGALGTEEEFKREWCARGPGENWIVSDPQALGTFLREKRIAIRRTEADVGKERPPLNVITHTVPFDQNVFQVSDAVVRKLAERVLTAETFHERGKAARDFDMLLRKITGVAKAPHVAAFVRILLEAGQPVVLCGWHREVYDIWLRELSRFRPVMFTGSETPGQKAAAKRAFCSGESNLFIMSLRSGAGLDGLQHRCRTIVFGELDWSPQVHAQCNGRLRRPGQTHQVDAIYLHADDGSDPGIIAALGLKASQSQGITDPLAAPADQHSDATRIQRLAELYLAGRSAEAAPPPVAKAEPTQQTLNIFEDVA